MCDRLVILPHWSRVTHIYVGKLTIIGSDNGLSPARRLVIIWTNAAILLIRPSKTNFNEILIEIDVFSFRKINLKMSSGKWRPFCLGLNILKRFTGTLHELSAYYCTCWYRSIALCPSSSLILSTQGQGSTFSFLVDTFICRKISNITRTKSPNLNVSRIVLQFSLPNPMMPTVKSRMKMSLEQRRQAMLQIHLSDRQFYWNTLEHIGTHPEYCRTTGVLHTLHLG